MKLEDLFNYQNLYRSYLTARKRKRHKDEVILFGLNLEENLLTIENDLIKGTYQFDGYKSFKIYEPKERLVEYISFKDRIVQHCLVDYYLTPLLERHLIFDNASCRKKKGTDFARRRIRVFLNRYYCENRTNAGYVLKFDIHQFFPSIKHERLKEKLGRIIEDKEILLFLFRVIDEYGSKGLPIGNQTSQCFGLLYLDEVDRLIKERFSMKYYSRYMDDGIVISKDKEILIRLYEAIGPILEKDGLTYNPKTRIVSLKEGFEYLGFYFRMNSNGKISMKIPAKKKQRMKHYLQKRIKIDSTYNPSALLGYLSKEKR